ncbi:P-loop NTPase fold protein [Pseudomonas sp. 10B1]|uniref:KAP family P-loop NTPase fold protein n=1 Tax=unclassified Pseudomonas TaxID=196821 RepID=UPI002B23EC06|nr:MULTISPECIES: P-loop NTPase fold protein [unclassified Pseudomonas]MEA9992921.1 P-loop NTPase fold protein [Pseudomonas sp. AA4]MEB0089096.1 P-loop NTPase fold protein [Pseudomonas sp. RTI1]MEB0125701.1 P-loop NTPase fold protein [Pseudomonas sp. CCC1.2]MEB0151506.1 P-loop NTPase fold protein [Pseudomonas sp. CCC4.3]MEB0220509.1 P-loop NTPase fold protein [Pseudomonas sp. AB12(2023)]
MIGLWTRLSAWHARRQAKLKNDAATANQPICEIGSEAPIRTKSEDRLRRADFADRIARVLSELSPREGIVFAIRGGWGFGKSSLKNLISERLEARSDDTPWLDFNPWQWGDSSAIARALFGQIADRLGGENSKAEHARAEALRHYGAILTGASAPLKNASGSNHVISSVLTNASVLFVASAIGFDLPTVAKIAAALAALSVGTSLLGRTLLHLGKDRTGEPLDKVREALDARLRELQRPLIVFVDDIDRLEPEQIRALLRQVKANANLPNIVFVLLFQSSIVERALDPVADGDGRAFLEKIVQSNFDLPAVPVSIVHRIFLEELSQLVHRYATEANGFSQTRWGNALIGCIQPRLRNMRDARRLISSIAVHMPLHASGEVFEVNIVDFLVLEALRVFESDLHEALFQERALVLQERRFQGDGRQDAERAAADRFLEVVPEERRAIARDTIKELFPPLEWAFGGTNYSEGFHLNWLAAKRVCSPRYFPRYFELQTALGEISERRFVEFLASTATDAGLAATIAEVEADGLLPSLAARFDESVDRLPVENAAVLLPGMFSIAQKLVGQHGDSFNSPWISAWRATSWFLKRIPEELRGGLTLEALRRTSALSVAAILIHLNDPADQKEGKAGTFDPVLDLDTVEAMKALWLELIRRRAAGGYALITEPDLVPQLYRWKDYSGSFDEPCCWMLEAIRTDDGFASMATRMMSTGTSHSWGDRVSTVHNMFNRDTVRDFIGIDVAKARCEAINPADFSEHELSLTTLHNHLKIWLGIKEDDLFY